MKFKILHELQKHHKTITNLDCNESFQFFRQIITTNINHFVPTEIRDKINQKTWIDNENKTMPSKKQKNYANYISSGRDSHKAKFAKN